LRTAIYLLLTYLLTYLHDTKAQQVPRPERDGDKGGGVTELFYERLRTAKFI